jgi:hypothetical protein
MPQLSRAAKRSTAGASSALWAAARGRNLIKVVFSFLFLEGRV